MENEKEWRTVRVVTPSGEIVDKKIKTSIEDLKKLFDCQEKSKDIIAKIGFAKREIGHDDLKLIGILKEIDDYKINNRSGTLLSKLKQLYKFENIESVIEMLNVNYKDLTEILFDRFSNKRSRGALRNHHINIIPGLVLLSWENDDFIFCIASRKMSV